MSNINLSTRQTLPQTNYNNSPHPTATTTATTTAKLPPTDIGAPFGPASDRGAGIAALTKPGPQPMSICWAAAT